MTSHLAQEATFSLSVFGFADDQLTHCDARSMLQESKCNFVAGGGHSLHVAVASVVESVVHESSDFDAALHAHPAYLYVVVAEGDEVAAALVDSRFAGDDEADGPILMVMEGQLVDSNLSPFFVLLAPGSSWQIFCSVRLHFFHSKRKKL